jgi:hypothetical protein
LRDGSAGNLLIRGFCSRLPHAAPREARVGSQIGQQGPGPLGVVAWGDPDRVFGDEFGRALGGVRLR